MRPALGGYLRKIPTVPRLRTAPCVAAGAGGAEPSDPPHRQPPAEPPRARAAPPGLASRLPAGFLVSPARLLELHVARGVPTELGGVASGVDAAGEFRPPATRGPE